MHGTRDMKITVLKTTLLRKLRENREKHLRDFERAKEGYKEAALLALQKKLEIFSQFNGDSKEVPNLDFGKCPRPVCFIKDYDRAIGMLELHAEDKLILDMEAYQRFIEDSWDWKDTFHRSSSSYLVGDQGE